MAQRDSTWQIWLIAVAALASKVVVFAGVAWMPLALDALGVAHAAPAAASFIERLCQWDCGWYAGIMTEGYVEEPPDDLAGEVNWAFFPAFPLLVRVVASSLGMPILVAAVLLNCCLAVAATLLLHALARESVGPRGALAAALLFAFSPFSLYLAVPYTEALYNALSLGAVLLACRRRWLACGLCLALLTATRSTGALVAPAIVAVAWKLGVWGGARRNGLNEETTRFLLCLLLLPLGLMVYMAFLASHTGDALAFVHAQTAWGREFGEPFSRILSGIFGDDGRDRYNAVCAVFGLVAAVCLWRLNAAPFGRPAAIFLLLTILIAASSGILSLARFVWATWPPYLLLGAWLGRASKFGATTAACLLLSVGLLLGASAMWSVGWFYLT